MCPLTRLRKISELDFLDTGKPKCKEKRDLNMAKNPTRITVAFDQSTANLLEKISTETELSQSEIMRRAIKFYNDNKSLTDPAVRRKAYAYMDLLLGGEHVILDVDHWLLFLQLIENSPDKEKFWAEHKAVARAHKEQLKSRVHSAEELLTRLELATSTG